MTFEYNSFWFYVLITIGIFFISLAIFFAVNMAYGQDIDPNGYCFYKTFPYIQLCYDQQRNDLYDKLLDRAREWNNQ